MKNEYHASTEDTSTLASSPAPMLMSRGDSGGGSTSGFGGGDYGVASYGYSSWTYSYYHMFAWRGVQVWKDT